MNELTITAKCSDMCFIKYIAPDGLTVTNDGYVPEGLGIGGGDYVELTIDAETGQIKGWKPLKKFQVLRAMQEA